MLLPLQSQKPRKAWLCSRTGRHGGDMPPAPQVYLVFYEHHRQNPRQNSNRLLSSLLVSAVTRAPKVPINEWRQQPWAITPRKGQTTVGADQEFILFH